MPAELDAHAAGVFVRRRLYDDWVDAARPALVDLVDDRLHSLLVLVVAVTEGRDEHFSAVVVVKHVHTCHAKRGKRGSAGSVR